MTELPRTYKRPVEECAKALCAEASRGIGTPLFNLQWDSFGAVYEEQASIVIDRLRDLGFVTSDGLAAIHAEEEANGQPRSVLPRYAPPPEQETR